MSRRSGGKSRIGYDLKTYRSVLRRLTGALDSRAFAESG
jgi:hypothetical protein